jgi:hypothetical protein
VQWLIPVIIATQETETGKVVVLGLHSLNPTVSSNCFYIFLLPFTRKFVRELTSSPWPNLTSVHVN